MSLDRKDFRSDIVLGEVALRLAVDSYGDKGAASGDAIVNRAKTIYSWLLMERKP